MELNKIFFLGVNLINAFYVPSEPDTEIKSNIVIAVATKYMNMHSILKLDSQKKNETGHCNRVNTLSKYIKQTNLTV